MVEKDYKLNLKNDYVFKMMHYMDEKNGKELFKSLVESFTGLKVSHVRFEQTELYSFHPSGKDVRFDLNATLNTKDAIDVEMQVRHIEATPDRLNYYAAMLYVNQANKGLEYDEFASAHCIFLCASDVYPDNEKWSYQFMMKDGPEELLTEKMKAYMIEMNKGLKSLRRKDHVDQLTMAEKWILFLMRYEENSTDPMVKELIETEEIFHKAVEVLQMMSEDARLREIAFARERYLRDQRQIEKEHKRALKKQYEAGHTEGKAEGKAEGIASERSKVIAEMLKDGVNDSTIMKYTHCTQEMIEQIKKSLV